MRRALDICQFTAYQTGMYRELLDLNERYPSIRIIALLRLLQWSGARPKDTFSDIQLKFSQIVTIQGILHYYNFLKKMLPRAHENLALSIFDGEILAFYAALFLGGIKALLNLLLSLLRYVPHSTTRDNNI